MLSTRGYATSGPTAKLVPFTFERREPGPNDVLIEISHCGICHSDIHQARDEWGGALFPMVPGHEIVGRVTRVGAKVTRFKAGDPAGVGCFVDSCRTCESCRASEEQYCEVHTAFTYNCTEMDNKTLTYGGYSSHIVVDERYVFTVSPKLPPANVAPLLCAGITTYAPLRQYNVRPGQQVGIVGLGGLGHMGVKLASAMGAEVTVFTTSRAKAADARRLGAQQVVVTTEAGALDPLAGRFHMILDTVSASHDLNAYLNLLRRDGTLALVGVPNQPLPVQPFQLILKRRRLAGSLIGGIRQTQEMLDYCAAHNITADVEVIPIQQVETAYERTIKGDVRYRFVIDMSTL